MVESKDIEYKVFSVRLSDEVIEELKKRRKTLRSWNLLFKELLEMKTPFKLKQKKQK